MRSCGWMHLLISSLWGHVAGMRCMPGGSLCSLSIGVLHARLVPEDGDGHGRITQYARHALDRFLARKRIALTSQKRARCWWPKRLMRQRPWRERRCL